MNTLLLDPIRDDGALRQAGALLRAGEVVGMPTETVYGLAANALDGAAVAKIFLAKGRPQDNPLIVHIADKEQLSTLARMVPESARKLADAFWPGPLTIILPKAACIPDEVSAGLDTVGIRLPSHPVARALIREAGVPLAAPSANLSGRPSTTTSGHVMDDLGGKIPAIVEGGPCAVGVESTVVSLAGNVPRLLRPGGVSLEQLESVLGSVEVDRALREKIGDEVRVSAPGMKYRHYAPKAPVTVVCGDPERTAVYITRHAGLDAGVICFSECAFQFEMHERRVIGSSDDVQTQARRVFDALRSFDATDVTEIWAQCPDDTGLGLAVANRLKKAAGFKVVNVV
ncbi:MAG: threonylcarbamoyl-AMP synthase [Butyricicoccus pullicaecorum]|nr:threonylcarbamoyl-AMP synthase [Butyricicoccus pullicaecorum]